MAGSTGFDDADVTDNDIVPEGTDGTAAELDADTELKESLDCNFRFALAGRSDSLASDIATTLFSILVGSEDAAEVNAAVETLKRFLRTDDAAGFEEDGPSMRTEEDGRLTTLAKDSPGCLSSDVAALTLPE